MTIATRSVNFTPLVLDGTGSPAIATGYYLITPTGSYRDGVGRVGVLSLQVNIDHAAVAVDLPVTGLGWALKVVGTFIDRTGLTGAAWTTTEYVTIPAGGGALEFEELTRVNPATLTAEITPPDPAWWTALTGVTALAVATAADILTVIGDASAFPGIDPTGATSSTTGLQAWLDAIPDGGAGELPAGTYLASGLTVTGKSVSLRLGLARFVQETNAVVLTCTGGFDTPIAVTTLGTTSITDSGGTTLHAALTMTSAPGWAAGDIVKVYSDDVIPEGRPGTGGQEKRLGEFATVHSCAGTDVVLTGPMRDTGYATTIRAARLGAHTVTVDRWHSSTPDTGMATFNVGQLWFKSLRNPTVGIVRIPQGGGQGVMFSSCYGYSVESFDISHLVNDVANGQFGYAFLDKSSEGGRLLGGMIQDVRHGFTDDTSWTLVGDTNPANYGRSRGAEVHGTAFGTIGGAWDTHQAGEGHRFYITSIGCPVGLQFRGKGHRAYRPIIRSCTKGIWAFVETTHGVVAGSHGHQVFDPDVSGTQFGCEAETLANTGITVLTLSGGRIAALASPLVVANADVVLEAGVVLAASAADTASRKCVEITADGTVAVNDAVLDLRAWGDTGDNLRAVRVTDASSSITGRKLSILAAGTGSRHTSVILGTSGDEGAADLAEVTFDTAFVTDALHLMGASSRVDYRVADGAVNRVSHNGVAFVTGREKRKSTGFLSTFGNNPMTAAMANTTSTTLNTANDAVLIPVTPDEDTTISVLTWTAGATSNGNYDVGLYTYSGTRLASKGSTAWPSISTAEDTAITATPLKGGVTYWLAFAADNNTGTFRGVLTAGLAQVQMLDGTSFSRRVASSFPLPPTISSGSTNASRYPAISLREV